MTFIIYDYRYRFLVFPLVTPVMENQMEQKMEHEMETRVIQRCIGIEGSQNWGYHVGPTYMESSFLGIYLGPLAFGNYHLCIV